MARTRLGIGWTAFSFFIFHFSFFISAVAADAPLVFLRAPGPVVVDGNLSDWTLTASVSFEVDPNAISDKSAACYAMWDDQSLYLACVVRDASPMKNAGNDPSAAFKSGDTVHFYLGTDDPAAPATANGGPNDYHVLMTIQQGKPVVFAFRQKKAGVEKPVVIASPATRIELDWMGPVPGAELAVTAAHQSYTAEARLPVAFFDGFAPKAGMKVAVDVAVNFSDATGASNMAKVWWHRGSSQILDIPSELRFDRNLWGTGEFLAAGQQAVVINNQNFFVVPAPGKVAVDGDLGDWDASCGYGPQYVDPALRDRNNVTWLAMHDADALYLGAVFNSALPYQNDGGVNNVWWQGDSLEFRISADTAKQNVDPRHNADILTFGVWHNPEENKDYAALQRSFAFTIADVAGIAVRSRKTDTGRTFEVRVPWSVVQSGNHPKPGDSVPFTLAAIWKNGLRAFGMGSISSFRGMNDWGRAHFLKKGKPERVYLNIQKAVAGEADISAGRFTATIKVRAKGLLSAGVYSADGKLLRTLFSGKAVEPGDLKIGWDGKDDLGNELPAGKYQVRLVHNAGLHASYVTSATSPGNPPHASTVPTRGWGGVWGNVQDVAADASGVYVLWAMEEGDGALVHMDENGQIIWRQHIPLALHGAQRCVASNGTHVYCTVDVVGKDSTRAGLWRVSCKNGSYEPFEHEGADPLAFYLDGIEGPIPQKDHVSPDAAPPVAGLAADAGKLYASAYYQNEIVICNAASGRREDSIKIDRPRGVCLDGPAKLLAVSGTGIVSVDIKAKTVKPVVTAGLDAPWDVGRGSDGSIIATDRGDRSGRGGSQQVKCFDRFGRNDRAGKLIATYGGRGGRDNNGKYDPGKLRNPAGVTVAASGAIFFSEDAPPRAFYRLGKKLQLEKFWSGPWYLSGEVTVDPARPEHLYMWSHEAFIRHVIDYEKRSSTPDAVWSDFALPVGSYGRWFPRIITHNGHKYMFCGGNPVTLFRIDGYKALLIAAIGSDGKSPDRPLWIFTDLNENGKLDNGERIDYPGVGGQRTGGSYWGGSINPDDLTVYYLDGSRSAIVLKPEITATGMPMYNFTDPLVIPLDQAQKPGTRANVSSIWHAPNGGVFGNADVSGSDPRGIGHSSHLSDTFVFRLDAKGNLVWRAGSKASGIAKNGQFYGRMCGMAGPVADRYFSFVDENGQDKVYTIDGLFVGNLLEDTAVAEPSENTLFVEHFNSIAYRNAKDGKWYFVAGASGYASIWEIAGLETVTRMEAEMKKN